MRSMLKSKIHQATVTDCNVNYEGSVTIDRRLLKHADIKPFEQVHVLDIHNGARLVTYAIEGGQGEVCLNGAAAHLVKKGDDVIILSYTLVNEKTAQGHRPRLIYVDSNNSIVATKWTPESIALYT